jgi:Cys-tRNA(Pro) deacylase
MGIKKVKTYFQENNYNFEVFEFETSTATVELAARALGVEPDLIAKTMSFKLKNEENILVVAAREKRVDNRKFKDCFQSKARMLDQDEVLEVTGHPVGGVCPFALKNKLKIYLDISLKKYQYVYPAAGSPSSAVKITPEQLQEVTGGEWVDVCK